ncbi:uncharacterized protein LOC111643453 [Copidosoma floridanum]|uniref:uncharacterized protein LOC111643453 n=1 Tax=Copidosoma floridanum TaxID=29053 RepID=UPI000C6F6F2E|nr:uncharacterized protein LOC111643453 [Copidosoma floridanum]
MITCLIENGLDPGTYANMKKDGTFNVETILSNSAFGEEGNRKLDGIVNICKLQAGSDICKLARCYQDLKKSPN